MLNIILLAAGSSERFGQSSKIFTDLNNSPLFLHSLKTFLKLKEKKEIILVIQQEDKSKIEEILESEDLLSKVHLVIGGNTRQKSVFKAFESIHSISYQLKAKSYFLIHNTANPLITEKEIKNCLQAAKKTGIAAIGNKIVDTIKKIDAKGNVNTMSRQNLYAMQTPQIIRYDIFEAAYNLAKKTNFEGTDDISLVENYLSSHPRGGGDLANLKIKIIPGSKENFKITYKEDLELARKILNSKFLILNSQKIGIGEDAHLFEDPTSFGKESGLARLTSFGQGGELTLGGIKFKEYPPFKANSDGDVMIHSLCNAISSALGGKSLGSFGNKMCLEEEITDSKKFLEPLLEKLKNQNLQIQSVSFSLECNIPKIDPISDKLKSNIAKILNISKTQIGITATTGNKTSVVGEGKGVRCSCVILIAAI